MLFARRLEPGFFERLRVAMWPRRSWGRSARYVRLRLVRLQASPHRVALGAAAGIFAAFTPFLGAQMLLAVLLAAVLRASVPAALLGTFIGNPLSWPAIWAGTYAAGCFIMGTDAVAHAAEIERRFGMLSEAVRSGSVENLEGAAEVAAPLLMPMIAGSVPLGLAIALLFYWGLRRAVAAAQIRRQLAHAKA